MSDDEVFVTARDLNNDENAAPSSDDTSPLQNKFDNYLSVDIAAASAKLRSSLIKEGSRRSPSKKTVSFSSMPAEKKISNVTDCLSYMQNGCDLIKVRSGARRYRRRFSLDVDLTHLRWAPSSKKAHKAKIPVETIREIRVGRNTENLRNSESCFEELAEDCAFSVIWGEEYQCLDLIANTPDEANIWVTGLVALTSGNLPQQSNSTENGASTLRDRWLEDTFIKMSEIAADEASIIKLIREINPRLPVCKIQQKLKELDNSKVDGTKGTFSHYELCDMYRDLATRPEIYFLMVRYANKDYLTAEDLQIFLETEQGVLGATLEYCQQLIETFEPSELGRQEGKMTVDGFSNYLQSAECDLFDTVHSKVCQDMSQPFCNYFVSTSYNTYLAEDQLKGVSSVDAYIHALKMGCRFVELDVWENEDEKTEPVVYHGHTMTHKLPVTKALTAIKAYAFEKTQYPLIVQLENHLEVEAQRRLATLLKNIFNDLLLVNSKPRSNGDSPDDFYSPEQYKGKILLKGRKLDDDCNDSEGDVTDEDESAEANKSSRALKKMGTCKKRRLCKELSDLICPFMRSATFRDLPTQLNEQSRLHVCSLNESTSLRLSAHYPQDFVDYTRRYLTRVYPNAVRVDSSNMNPQEFWNCGCQMVALNFQTPGLMIDLLRGKFAANGSCGYVLKPLVMRDEQAYFSPRDSFTNLSPQTLHLKIISAQQLPRPRGSTAKGDSLDPFVIVEVFGVPCDCAEERTKTVQNDGFNPVFDESFQFDVSVPELTLIRFLVLDDDYIGDDFIGQYTIPFDCLQTGYRHVTLLNINGEPLENSTLFLHIAVTNKRGGGKAKKRGVSVRRKQNKVHTGVKQIGVKQLDDVFKVAIPLVAECIQLRGGLENNLAQWQESCGLGPAATMRQGLRLMYSRLVAAAQPNDPVPQMEVIVEDGFPNINLIGNIPEILRKSCLSFERLVAQCRLIMDRTDPLLTKLEDIHRRISECYDEMCGGSRPESNLKGQRATRASENFAWNLRLLKAQIEIMGKIHQECKDHVKQIIDTACLLNVLREQCQQPCAHRTQHINSV